MSRPLLRAALAVLAALFPVLARADSDVPSLTAGTSLTSASMYLANAGATNNKLGLTTSVFDIAAGALTLKAGAVTDAMLASTFLKINPALGTPISGVATKLTGLPISTGVAGLGTGTATALAVNIGGAGSVLVNGGALGTPSSGTLTNATGLPIAGIAGLGSGVGTFLATPTSANLGTAITDKTGSGAAVFGTGPTVSAPTVSGVPIFSGLASGSQVSCLGLDSGNHVVLNLAACGAGGGGGGSPGGSTNDIQFKSGSSTFGGLTLTDGQVIVGQTSAAPLARTLTGDVTLAADGTTTIGNGVVSDAMLASTFLKINPALGTPISGVATNLTGTAASLTVGHVTTNANLTGPVTSTGNATAIAAGTITDAMLASTFLKINPALGTPVSGVATNLTGTAAGLTAGTVTTNANLTGPITSSGNATAIASQTGTGTKFVMDTSPTLVTPVLGVASATSITGLATPVNPSDAANKAYADAIAAGIVVHAASNAATTANLSATYANGTAGVGATLTNNSTQAAFAVDDYSASLNDRILVKDQTTTFQNGIYTVTTVGSGAANWVLTRATDFDAAASNEVAAGASTVVLSGTVNTKTLWIETGQGPFTIGSTAIVFSQITTTGTGSVNSGTANQFGYYAGTGTAISGTSLTGLVKGNGASAPGVYAGTSCTNQFPRSLDLNGAATCATVGSSDLASSLALTTPNIGAGTGTSLSVSGQLTSTVATGTAPLVVSSTTQVANLNAATLGGATFAVPGAIGGGTPAAGAFTTLAASSTVSGTGFSTYLASPPAIGGSAAAAGSFTALSGTSGTHTGITGLGIRDTSAAFDVTLAGTSSTALSAGRTLTLDMKNVAHTLAFGSTANTITFPSTASYTLVGSNDTGTVTNTMLAGSIDLASKVTGTLAVARGGTGLTAGNSGGVLAYTGSGTLASSSALTANLPVIGGGAGAAPSVGTRSGNTTTFVTTTGTQTFGDCVKIDANGNHIANGSACAGTPVVFIGPQTAGSANTYTQAVTTPTGFALTDGFIVRTRINATNTGASTLNVNSTGATAIQTNTLTGLQALAGGELAANLQYDFTYNGTCACFVLMNAPSGVVTAGTTQTITTAQWTAFTVFDVTTGGQTLTLPLASTLSPNGGIVIRGDGQSVTLAPNASDKVNNGSTGASVTIAAGTSVVVTTDAAAAPGNIWAPLGAPATIVSGTSALGTSAIGSAACATVVTTAATGTATTDVVTASFNGDPTAVTGYIPSTAGMLTIISYPTANNVNFKVCNNTSSTITPGAITLNWRIVR